MGHCLCGNVFAGSCYHLSLPSLLPGTTANVAFFSSLCFPKIHPLTGSEGDPAARDASLHARQATRSCILQGMSHSKTPILWQISQISKFGVIRWGNKITQWDRGKYLKRLDSRSITMAQVALVPLGWKRFFSARGTSATSIFPPFLPPPRKWLSTLSLSLSPSLRTYLKAAKSINKDRVWRGQGRKGRRLPGENSIT